MSNHKTRLRVKAVPKNLKEEEIESRVILGINTIVRALEGSSVKPKSS